MYSSINRVHTDNIQCLGAYVPFYLAQSQFYFFTIQTSFANFTSHTDEKSNDIAEWLNKHELVKEELNWWPFSFYSQVRVIYEVDCGRHLITG